MLKTINIQTHQVSKQKNQKKLKTKKIPPQTHNNQKLKKDCSSELMLKTINVQTLGYQTKNSKHSKTQKLPPKTPKNQRSALVN